MKLILDIIKSPQGVSLAKTQMEFAEVGGDIGRSDRNDWILADPERFISSKHCSIQYDDGQYYLADFSTNGTYLNSTEAPIGKGERQVLADGMRITLGDYEFAVSLSAGAEQSPQNNNPAFPGAFGPFANDDPLASNDLHEAIQEPMFAEDIPLNPPLDGIDKGLPSSTSSNAPVIETGSTLDPLKALDDIHRNKSNDVPFLQLHGQDNAYSQGDHAPLAEHAFTPPNVMANEMIPEDWDNTEFGFHSANADNMVVARRKPKVKSGPPTLNKRIRKKAAARQTASKKVAPNKDAPEKAMPTTQGAAPTSNHINQQAALVDNNLIEAMGLKRSDFSQAQLAQLNQVAGQFIRQTVSGLLNVLRARSTIKNELRLGVTTVQPSDNNPIKFSADVDVAMEHLFLRQSKAYLPAISSVNESFESILAHQVAVLAGMRAAFNSLIKRFDPTELTNKFESQNGAGIFSGNKKVKNWDAYMEYYQAQVNDLDDSFQHLFGEEFVKAYESQLIKLEIARNNEKKTRE